MTSGKTKDDWPDGISSTLGGADLPGKTLRLVAVRREPEGLAEAGGNRPPVGHKYGNVVRPDSEAAGWPGRINDGFGVSRGLYKE